MPEDQLLSMQYNLAESTHNDLNQCYRVKLFPSLMILTASLSLSVFIGLHFPQVLHCELSTWMVTFHLIVTIACSDLHKFTVNAFFSEDK